MRYNEFSPTKKEITVPHTELGFFFSDNPLDILKIKFADTLIPTEIPFQAPLRKSNSWEISKIFSTQDADQPFQKSLTMKFNYTSKLHDYEKGYGIE